MLNDRRIGFMAVGAVALVFLLGWVSTAEARTFSMTGKWVQRRGVAYIPVQPGAAGMPGAGNVAAKGSSPASLTVAPGRFGGPFAALFPLPQASLIQLSTQFLAAGPKSSGFFKANFWAGNRPFATFAFCPGATANPACVDPKSVGQGAAAGQGTKHGLVRYTKTGAGFGGTMQMVMGGGGALAIKIGVSPTQVLHNPFGGATGAAPTEAPGGAYANTNVDVLPGGPITISPGISGGGLITAPGAQVGTGSATTIRNVGFSWTTGKVYVKGTDPGPGPTVTTVTITGSDSRTALGAGNITLVAGGIGNRIGPSGRTFMDFDKIEMTLGEYAIPALSPTGLLAFGGLMLLMMGYFMRSRLG